jgi:hypothetical protein
VKEEVQKDFISYLKLEGCGQGPAVALPAWNRQSLSENGDHEEEVEFRYRGQS